MIREGSWQQQQSQMWRYLKRWLADAKRVEYSETSSVDIVQLSKHKKRNTIWGIVTHVIIKQIQYRPTRT